MCAETSILRSPLLVCSVPNHPSRHTRVLTRCAKSSVWVGRSVPKHPCAETVFGRNIRDPRRWPRNYTIQNDLSTNPFHKTVCDGVIIIYQTSCVRYYISHIVMYHFFTVFVNKGIAHVHFLTKTSLSLRNGYGYTKRCYLIGLIYTRDHSAAIFHQYKVAVIVFREKNLWFQVPWRISEGKCERVT